MSTNESRALVMEAFRAVEQRDEQGFLAVCHPEVEFHWPSPLP
jgi:hypothetical protein